MIYHLNEYIGKNLTGIEHAAIRRHKLFKKNNIDSKIVTSQYNNNHRHITLHGLEEPDVESMYDYFQDAQAVSSEPLSMYDVFPHSTYNIRKVSYTYDAYNIYDNERKIAFVRCLENEETLSYISYLDSAGRWVKRLFYDSRGFMSCEKIMGNERFINMEIYYTPNGKKVIEKFFTKENGKSLLTLIRVKTKQGKVKHFFTESEFIAYYLDNLLNENRDLVIIDRSIVYTEPVINLKKKVKTISVIHSVHTFSNNYMKGPINNHYKMLLSNLDHINSIVVSTETQRQDIIKRFGYAEKIICISVGTREDNERIPLTNPPIIISAGRLEEEKRQNHIITAFNEVVKKIPEAELHFYGTGSKEKDLKKQVSELQLNEKITFHGYIENPTAEYKTAKLFVLTSTVEGFALVLLEAASLGIPAVSYNIKYGPRDLIEEGKTGFLTSENPLILADRIVELLSNKKLYEKFSKNAYNRSFKFDEKIIFKKWKDLLKSIDYKYSY